jgi:hypothetical protein
VQNLKTVYRKFGYNGKDMLFNALFNTQTRNFSKKSKDYTFPKYFGKINFQQQEKLEDKYNQSSYLQDFESDITKQIDIKKFSQIEEEPTSNISYFSNYQDPLKNYTVDKLVPKCGVEDFYPNGNPSLPNPKTMQDTINEYIQTEIKNGNEEMKNKFVCVMTDKHFNHFHEICNAPSVLDTLFYFDMNPPDKEKSKKVFDLDSKNGNLMFAVCDVQNKKVMGCFGVRFHTIQRPSKEGGYKEMLVPEIWSKMSEPMKGMSSLLRKNQEELYNNGYEVTYARIPCNHLLLWQPHSQKIFKMIPSFKLPTKGGGMDIQTYYGYKDKTEEKIPKEKQHFLNTMCSQILHNGSLVAKENTSDKTEETNNKGFGR